MLFFFASNEMSLSVYIVSDFANLGILVNRRKITQGREGLAKDSEKGEER